MLIFIAFLAGVIFTGFMGIVERFRLTRTINRLNKTIRDLRREMKANENPSDVEEEGKTIRRRPGKKSVKMDRQGVGGVLEARFCFRGAP